MTVLLEALKPNYGLDLVLTVPRFGLPSIGAPLDRRGGGSAAVLLAITKPARLYVPDRASFVHLFEKCLELAGARRAAQLAQRLGFDLADGIRVLAIKAVV